MEKKLLDNLRSTTQEVTKKKETEQEREARNAQRRQRRKVAAYVAEHLDGFVEELTTEAKEAAKDGRNEASISRFTHSRTEVSGLAATMDKLKEHFEDEGFQVDRTWSDNYQPHYDREGIDATEWRIGVAISWDPEG